MRRLRGLGWGTKRIAGELGCGRLNCLVGLRLADVPDEVLVYVLGHLGEPPTDRADRGLRQRAGPRVPASQSFILRS